MRGINVTDYFVMGIFPLCLVHCQIARQLTFDQLVVCLLFVGGEEWEDFESGAGCGITFYQGCRNDRVWRSLAFFIVYFGFTLVVVPHFIFGLVLEEFLDLVLV